MKITIDLEVSDLIQIIAALDAAKQDMLRPLPDMALSNYAISCADRYGEIKARLEAIRREAMR